MSQEFRLDKGGLINRDKIFFFKFNGKNYFGLGKPHPQLAQRIGDYVLLMKENYIIKDFLLGEEEHFSIGNHGGLSEDEMYVPLIRVDL